MARREGRIAPGVRTERVASEKRFERKPDCKCENKSRPTLKEPDRGPRFQEGRPHRAKRRATLAELSVRRDEACIKHSFPTRFCPRAARDIPALSASSKKTLSCTVGQGMRGRTV